MSAQNRTALKALITAWAATLDLEVDDKPTMQHILDSVLLKRDVTLSIRPTGAGTENVDFANYDTIEIDTPYDITANIQNIVDGDVKFLYITKTAGIQVLFTGATQIVYNQAYVNTLTDIIYIITKKISTTVIAYPLNLTINPYTQDEVDALITGITTTTLDGISFTKYEIGGWNMDTTASTIVAHGLTFSDIIGVEVYIKNDVGVGATPLYKGGYYLTDSLQVRLYRDESGIYDNSSFDDDTINRGYIIIKHI